MKILKFSTMVMCTVLLFTTISCKSDKKTETKASPSQEETSVTEGEHEIILENDYAIVTKVTLKPGETQPEHNGERRVIYALTDYAIDWKEQGKNVGTKIWKKGDVHFHEAGKHSAKNNGSSIAEWLVFSKKNIPLPECGENLVENDVNSVASKFTSILFDNNDFKTTEVNLPTGESIPTHSGINRVIYALTDYQIIYESNKEEKGEKQFKTGDVHWHEACQHALQNNGETEAKFLVISYK